MPSFSRIGKQNNRSQQALVEPSAAGGSAVAAGAASGPAEGPGRAAAAAAAANTPHSQTQGHAHSASSTAFSSNESFDQHHQPQQTNPPPPQPPSLQQQAPSASQQQQSQPGSPPPPHLYNPAGAREPPPPLGASPVYGQPKQTHDFADAVSRSQSQRYPPVAPLHGQPPPGYASSSVDDLATTLNIGSPPPLHGQPAAPAPAPEKRSARKLIKNILTGSRNDHHHASRDQSAREAQQNAYDNTSGLHRRPSKRVGHNPPPALRTGPSQVSQLSALDQHPDWQPPPHPHGHQNLPSPLQGQGLGDIDEHYFEQDANRPPHLQNPEPLQTSIRRVPTNDQETTSPYGNEDIAYQHQQQQAAQQQLHGGQDPRLYGQAIFEPQQQQYQYASQQQPHGQYQGGPPQIYTHHLGNPQHQNPETISQLSHESPITDSDQRSATFQSAQTSPAVHYAGIQVQDHPLPPPPVQQINSPQGTQQQMAPPPGGPPGGRRSQETEKAMRTQGDTPAGPPPGYRHSQQQINQLNNPLPPPPTTGGQNAPGYRSGAGNINERSQPQYEGSGGEQGRNSPQPPTSEQNAAESEKAFKDLLGKYKNVKRLYFDGKAQVEQLSNQVEQLQNAIANQRMSQSRTALDDNEYTTRFNRLNGAINNLSFNIRKDWETVPSWLEKYVSADALKTGKQEMTAVGRAVITRWIVDEIFNRCFHPALEYDLSRQLKEIELNIRRFSYTMNSQEEFEALTAKVVSWRMATLEGLQRVLQSPESADHRSDFTKRAVTNLTAHLFKFLASPPPPGVDGSASMIVELAVGIASNLPMESRDVCISYPNPGETVQLSLMEVEKTALPPLESQGKPEGDRDGDGEDSGDSKENAKSGGSSKDRRAADKASRSGAPSSTSAGGPPKDPNKVRIAGFVAVEVRGRQVLMKAPVWTLG